MKKVFCIFLALVIAVGIATPVSATTQSSQRRIYSWERKELRETLPFEWDISIADFTETPDVKISKTCEELTRDLIDEMGQMIYFSKEYCDSTFDDYDLSVCIRGGKSSSIQIVWIYKFSDYGFLSDSRSGESVITIMDTLDDLCAFFPTLSSEISGSENVSSASESVTEQAAAITTGAPATNSTGITAKTTEPTTVPEETEPIGESFIVNKSSKKFHRMGCSFAPDESSKNYSVVNSTRESLEQQGYQPCKKCFKW